ncbi:unnamed protein product [Microthlaspi erraticum]|uniref:Uncharacterized protein n=1 Tax=Microthlaspi erraticum TaxID=1685480 RepID=A0A6D2LEA8_9BRAS|nr:unnamed protein product [Microthlaspi erraticum]
MSNAKLRDELKVSIAKKLVPEYREFYDKYLRQETNIEMLVRFKPDNLDNYLSDLFHGTVIFSDSSSSLSSSSCISLGCVFSNDDQDPREVVEYAITEARAWAAAQAGGETERVHTSVQGNQADSGEWCKIDGAWKATESRAGLGWYNFDPDSGSSLFGACNLRRGLSPLQTELEALVWAMQSMLAHNKRRMNFQTDCTELVKMVTKPEGWPTFEILLEEVEKCKRKFQAFSLTHIPRTTNTKADKLARSARAQPHDVYYVNSVPPIPLPEPI